MKKPIRQVIYLQHRLFCFLALFLWTCQSLVRSCYPHALVTLCIWRSYIPFHTAIPVVLYFISCISGYLQFANRTASTGRLYDAHRAHTLSSFIVTRNPRICMMFHPALLIFAYNIRKMHLLFPVLYPLLRMHIVQRCQITACYFLLVFLTSSLAYIYLFSWYLARSAYPIAQAQGGQ